MLGTRDAWREKYGRPLRTRDGWLVGATHGVFRIVGAILLPAAVLCVLHDYGPRNGETAGLVFKALAWLFLVASTLLLGTTNEVAIDLANGEVRTRRGLFGLARTRRLIRPQVDGLFMTVAINPDTGNPVCAVGVQAGLGRWAIYRSSDADKATELYREIRSATGYPGVP